MVSSCCCLNPQTNPHDRQDFGRSPANNGDHSSCDSDPMTFKCHVREAQANHKGWCDSRGGRLCPLTRRKRTCGGHRRWAESDPTATSGGSNCCSAPDWNRQCRLHRHHTCKDPAQPEKRVSHDVESGGVCQSPVIHSKLSPSRLLIVEHRSVDSC